MNYFRIIVSLFFCLLVVSTQAEPLPQDKFNFMAFSDIHFDPFISCTGNKPCSVIVKLHNADAGQWPKILAQYDVKPQEFKQDTGYRLLTSALLAIKQVADTSHPKFILLLGDSLGHEYREKYKRYAGDKGVGYQEFVRKTYDFLIKQLTVTFPSTDIYFAVGNHDSYQGSYYTKASGQFFTEVAPLWASLIHDATTRASMQKQFSYAGYYTLQLAYPDNLRLIVLNTNIFSYKGKGKNLNALAMQELQWLHKTLQAAKNAHQKVFITMHIPQGVDIYATTHTRLFRLITLWKPVYIKQFENIMQQFAPEIAGVFAGHLHRNQFQVLTYDNKYEVPAVNVTSISPIFGNQPGFRVIAYFTHPLHFDDVYTYSFPIGGGNAVAAKKEMEHLHCQPLLG